MPVQNDGTFNKRSTGQILEDLISALRDQFGNNVDVTPVSPIRKYLEAALLLPLAETENTMDDLYRQMFPSSASGDNLDKHLQFIGSSRKQASRSTGTVNINYTSEPSGSPLFASASLTVEDSNGESYNLTADIETPDDLFTFTPSSAVQSESIDATNTKIAQKIELSAEQYVQSFGAKVTHGGTAPKFKVTLETDNSGEPSGTLADDNLTLSGYAPNDGTTTRGFWEDGAYVDAGTYWLVFERESGDGTFEGGTNGTADQVKLFNASTWSLSSNIENANVILTEGGEGSVVATFFGSRGNIDASSITNVQFNNSAANAKWGSYVNDDNFTNKKAFSGGQNEETDRQYRARVRRELSLKPESSPSGIVTAMLGLDGVTSADIVENNSDTGGTENKVFDSDETGTASATTLNSSGDKIAQKLTTSNRRFIQHFNAKLSSDTDLVCSVRLETDSSGSPSGTLVDANLELSGFDFDGTSLTDGSWSDGTYVSAGTYWLVFTWESGSGTFDGGTGGTADQVKADTGSGWGLDANIENLNTEVIGGVPPHGFRVVVDGGTDTDIAEEIYDVKSAGIRTDGKDTANVTNRANQTIAVYFERPTNVDVYVDITLTKNADSFTGDEDTIKDIIIDYIGGTDTDGGSVTGLSLNDDLIRNEIISRVLDDDLVLGTVDVTDLKVDTTDPPTGTANLSPATGEVFVSAPANITVTLNDA